MYRSGKVACRKKCCISVIEHGYDRMRNSQEMIVNCRLVLRSLTYCSRVTIALNNRWSILELKKPRMRSYSFFFQPVTIILFYPIGEESLQQRFITFYLTERKLAQDLNPITRNTHSSHSLKSCILKNERNIP